MLIPWENQQHPTHPTHPRQFKQALTGSIWITTSATVLLAIWFTSAHLVPFPTNANQDHSKSQTFREPLGSSSLKGLCCTGLKHNQLTRLHSPTLRVIGMFPTSLVRWDTSRWRNVWKMSSVSCQVGSTPSPCLFVGDAPHHLLVWTRQIRYRTSLYWLGDGMATYHFISKKST